jgi:glycosyltransferase involved in cell wall biosynthesis
MLKTMNATNIKPISLSIFFPAYNEEDNIAEAVRQAEEAVKGITDTYEIIIVDDGSKDKTGQIADSLAKENPHIKVIHHSPNQGYGGAVWSGIQAAKYEYVFFTDADLQFDVRELSKLIEFIPRYEVVLGYRAKRKDPFMRLLNAKGWNILNRLLFGLRVKDIDCAFKLFKRDVVKDLPVKSRGAMLSAEMLIRLERKGVIFREVPVTHLPRLKGSPTGAKPAVILRAFKEMMLVYNSDLGPKPVKKA